MRIKSGIVTITLMISSMLMAMAQESVPVACAGSIVRYGVEGLPNSIFEWTVTGGQIVRNYNDSIDVLWGKETGSFFIQVIEHSEFECTADPYLASVEIETPYVDIGDVVNVCAGDTQTIVLSGNYKTFRWNDPSVTTTTYEVSGEGVVWVEIMDDNNCVNRDSVIVQLHDLPKVDLGEDAELCGDDYLVLDAGGDGIRYAWSTGNTGQTITVEQGEQKYSVEVSDQYGCTSYDTINILDCFPYEEFKKSIPTAFTPNGDGSNDMFILKHIEKWPDAEVEVFDRWGRRVFKSDVGYTIPWDGTFNGKELPTDSYYYIINLKGGNEPIAGSISIIR